MKSTYQHLLTSPVILWTPLIIYYGILLVGTIYSPFYELSLIVTNSGDKTNASESAFIEHLEAAYWLLGAITYGLSIKYKKKNKEHLMWPTLFMVICFFAFGEEISWGNIL